MEPSHILAKIPALLRKIWYVFAQACTVALALLFVLSTLRPDLLPRAGKNSIVLLQETAPGSEQAPKAAIPAGFRRGAEKAMPAVVNIYTSKAVRTQRNPLRDDPLFKRFFGEAPPQRTTSLGSGVVASPQGFVLTNHHVIEGADEIKLVLADGSTLDAKVIGSDPDSDLAVLKAEGSNLPAVTFGNSDALHVGDVVLAIGNPFGFGNTVTLGIVSALGRGLGINTFESFIQTDAAINPGNSGGALVDVEGNLIGINSNIYSRTGGSEGIGFAIPVTIARQVMESIIREGSVTRGWMGIDVQEMNSQIAEAFGLPKPAGVLVVRILRAGPADRGGLQLRDVILRIDGKDISDASALLTTIAALSPGRNVPVTVWRGGKESVLQVEVGKRPSAR